MSIPTDVLHSVIEHVFLPPKLPQRGPGEETVRKTNVALCNVLIEAAQDFLPNVPVSESALWMHMIKMMKLARRAAKTPFKVVDLGRALSDMALGDVFCIHIRAQNAALIVRRLAPADFVQFEVFEVSSPASASMRAGGKLLCSYPGPAIQIPVDTFMKDGFVRELSSFLVQMDIDIFGPTTFDESADPRHISGLLMGILSGFGQPAVVDRFTKRIGDEVLRSSRLKPWRRSPLWLILRVSLQSSLQSSNLYKLFILFFHAHLLRSCVHRDFPSELLYAMRVKTARRLSKLDPAVSHQVYQFVNDTAKETEDLLSQRWTTFQNIGLTSPTAQLKGLDFAADSHISLNKSSKYLTKMLLSASGGFSRMQFTPSHRSRLKDVHDFTQFTDGQLTKAIANHGRIAIADFELTVERNLKSWIAASTDNSNALDVISSCIQQYFSGAKDLYGDNAEDNSMMILTIMDLWVALDRFAIEGCPLLKQYSPEIPSYFLHCLLLHRSTALTRALHIEEYLCWRHEVAEATSVFSCGVDDSCFAVKYFCTSESLQHIYNEINTHAEQERAAKRAELASLNQRSKSLLTKASKMDHKQSRDKFGRESHSLTCRKCRLKKKAEALEIGVHEWPLPPSTRLAQITVFELSPPHAFSTWRDITYLILRDFGLHLVPDSSPQSKVLLDSFSGLRQWSMKNQQYYRVTIASDPSSSLDEMISIPAEEDKVLVDNGLSWKLFDCTRQSWAIDSFSGSSAARLCSPPIPTSSPYSRLHHFVSGTQHTQNDIIAAQADCPDEISLQEFIAFSGMRGGPRLQWLNVARELASPALRFSREEVHTLITQVAWQLGPLSNGVREWHIDLSLSSFGNVLLRELEYLLEKVKTNWHEEVTVRTITLICSRLLASTTDPDICRRACALLREARNVTYRWIDDVGTKLDIAQDEASRIGLQRRLCIVAATCFSTFDVCPEHVPATLATEEDFSIAMQSAVIVYDNTPPSLLDHRIPSKSPPPPASVLGPNSLYLNRLISRHLRLLHSLEPIFSECLPPDSVLTGSRARLLHASAYDHALARLWLGYRQCNSSWYALPEPNSRWISCVSEGEKEVHYNLLTGELLIGGKRIEKLPQEIMKHPTYTNIFGAKTLDVAPADIPGMDYVTRSTVSGSQILFAWNKGELVLQARMPDNPQILQLIPRTILLGDFPRHLVDEYHHWLDLSTGELEFRPARSPWTPEPSNWRICIQSPDILTEGNPRAMLLKHRQIISPIQLIDIRSTTFRVVSHFLSPLESPEHIIATYTAQTFEASLPRLNLSFFINTNWELECRSMPGYVIDNNQSCGTMFGLRNKLILCRCSTDSEEILLPRRVIIPQGDIFFKRDGDFTSIYINPETEEHIPGRWQEYTIDADLRCLTSNESLSSKLYQCYLHALTSHCLPDPLLGHTGTEEALYILQSAACRSFQRLDAHEAKLLKLISGLSPMRDYNGSAAKVKWDDLPALSQHHDFFLAVRSLLDHAHALEALYDQPANFKIYNCNQKLLNRAAFRNKSYYPSDLQISKQSPSLGDIEYHSRDVSDLEKAEDVTAAFQTSWSIWNAQPSSSLDPDHTLPELWDLLNSRNSLGPANSGISLQYSKDCLVDDSDDPFDWSVIFKLCRKSIIKRSRRNSRIELSFSLSAAAYSKSKVSNILPLIILALDKRCFNIISPLERFYAISDGLAPQLTRLEDLISKSALPMSSIPAHSLTVEGINAQNVELSPEEKYDEAIRRESSLVAESILHKWPNYQSVDFRKQWFHKSDCRRRIKDYMQSISRNTRLREYVLQLQSTLQHHGPVSIPATGPYVVSPQFAINQSKAPSYSLHDILVARTNTPAPSTDRVPFQGGAIPPTSAPEGIPQLVGSDDLKTLIEELRDSQQPLLQLYGDDLDESHRELLGQDASQFAQVAVPSGELLLHYHRECSDRKNKIFSQISAALSPSQNVEETSHIAGLWPRITPRSMLRQLAQDRISTLPDRWKFLIICYAVSFVNYQQSLRMLELSSRHKYDEILLEIKAITDDVLAESTPDWLLVQIEANLMARQVQVAVAHEMISPSSKRNISLQFNMGEGKSSVIIPLVASTLANGSALVRVVTPKPLSNQTFQLLISRLSGLANRPIFYLPISRGLSMDSTLVKTISGLYKRCVAEGGVLVGQAEHILSLKLMHIDILLRDDSLLIADELEDLQDWLAKVSRDILDESDETLRVQFQLIYSAGQPTLVDDHPNRWTTTQQVLRRLQVHAVELFARFPKMLAVDTRLKGFPIIRILDSAMSQRISSLIIDDAIGGQLYNLPLDTLPLPIQAAARRFMTHIEVSDIDHDLIHTHCAGTKLFNGILLLRGLLMDSEGILAYVLNERHWRVDYGLDPRRTLLAVPYKAKDVPSLRASFAHPDVAISLTCLSYYYGGLTKDQVLLCFDLLAKLDNPDMEYDHWVELLVGPDLPAELRRLNGVNTEDETQADKFLVPLFSRNERVVDFYLSQVVFPRAARDFPSKLPTSAWDLVEDNTNVTTGFSGTNDNRYLLPTSITQEDPKFVLRTNALVLQYLLRPENDHYECTEGENGEREYATAFLKRLVSRDPEIQVLLDVGAQMLELQNEELVRHWLLLRPDVSAAIFFNDSDHLMVITPGGTIEPFISSPFNRQLEKCVVYLDDAHTRGTDLNLPQGFRAAVTLGPKVTKDRLVQGCMRMRRLGKGHSVAFFAPGEIDRRIRSLIPNATASEDHGIRVLDVVRWAMHETCNDILHNLPCWAQQGLDHHKRSVAYKRYISTKHLGFLRSSWLQSESRTLEEIYWVKSGTKISPEIESISSISERIKRLGATELVDIRLAEEQEREVSQEVDTAGHMRRLPKVTPAQHIIPDDICHFIGTGKLPVSLPLIFPLLAPIDMAEALGSTTEWSPPPLATADFTTTNLDSGGVALTEFLRPVNWILSSGTGKDSIVVVISPHEANALLPMIRKSGKVRLHIYAPRVQSSMRSFSDLTFYSIPDSRAEPWSAPAHIRTELNLFAGQLYFDSRGEYDRVCTLLALSMAHRGAERKDMDGFVPRGYRTGKSSPFATSKIPILKTLIGLRQKGTGYHRTHMGQILNGKPLSEETLNSLVTIVA